MDDKNQVEKSEEEAKKINYSLIVWMSILAIFLLYSIANYDQTWKPMTRVRTH